VRRSLAVVGLLVFGCAGLAMTAAFGPADVGTTQSRRDGTRASAGLSGLPEAATGPVSAALGNDLAEYRVMGLRAVNVAQRLRASFSSDGVTISSGEMRFGLSLSAAGFGTTLRRVGAVVPRAQGNRVVYARSGVEEWWANGPLGLEQGFAVRSHPAGASGPLRLSVALSGRVDASLSGDGVLLRAGGASLGYRSLVATDAAGRELPARFSLQARRIMITVDDRGARYPVKVDPTVQQAELTASDGGTDDGLGSAVAVSGNTIVVGASEKGAYHNRGSAAGAVYVFQEPASGWANATQTAELTASGAVPDATLGYSVGISGNTIVAGAPAADGFCNGNVYLCGAAYVYVEPASGWTNTTTPTATLSATDQNIGNGAEQDFGASVAISGSTIVVGEPGQDFDGGNNQTTTPGAVYAFSEPAGGWASMTQTAELRASDPTACQTYCPLLGTSVGISGNTIVASAPGQNNGQGAVYVFSEPAGGWVSGTQTAELTPSAASGLIDSVAISGTTIAAGIPGYSGGRGGVFVYQEPAAGWANGTQTAILTASDGVNPDSLGYSVAIDKSTIVAAAPVRTVGSNAAQGLVYVFQEPAAGWSSETQSGEYIASDGGTGDELGKGDGSGEGGAISGGTIVAGSSGHDVSGNTSQGAAYVWVQSSLVVNSTQTITDAAEAAQGVCDADPGQAGTPLCTLGQAILVSKYDGGGTITFDIPNDGANTFDGSVPQIQDPAGAGMPTVVTPTTIDGTSQPSAGRVELSGTSADNQDATSKTVGLNLAAIGSTVNGLVINGYSDGIDVNAGGETIQGDWFGTNAAGTAADPNPLGTNSRSNQLVSQIGLLLSTSGNTVGGASSGQGNVFATHWGVNGQTRPAAALADAVGGNTIEGNTIGVVPGAQTELIDPQPTMIALPEDGLQVSGADTVGGLGTGAGNVLAPESAISGASVVQGNTFLGTLSASGPIQIGGPTVTAGTGRGNVFMPSTNTFVVGPELAIGGTGGVVQGNRFDPTSQSAIDDSGTATIGGTAANAGNLIKDTATEPPGPDGAYGVQAGIAIAGDDNTIENNVLEDNGGWGAVQIDEDHGNTITRNTMTGNALGIELGHDGYVYDTDVTKHNSGPNDYEYYPILLSTRSTHSRTEVTGRIEQPGTVTVDLYSEARCALQSETPGQGAKLLGSTEVSSGLGGKEFTFSTARTAAGQNAITATATSSNGSTSEFSPCLITDSHAPGLLTYGVTPAPGTVAVTSSAAMALTAAARHKQPVGHGRLWLLCPPKTKGRCTGTVLLRTTGWHPTTLQRTRFTIPAGFGDPIALSIPADVLANLKRHHKLTVKATISARDGAKHPHHKTTHRRITLVYN
jgi:FG-GAP repeat/Periplasmic copper-binding protein (NosD)